MSAAIAYVATGLLRFCAQCNVAALPLHMSRHHDASLSVSAVNVVEVLVVTLHASQVVHERVVICGASSAGPRSCGLAVQQDGRGWQAKTCGVPAVEQGAILVCACV